MSTSTGGIGGSILDVKSIVESLVKADITPAQTRLAKQANYLQTEVSAIGSLKSALSQFQSAMTNLSDLSKFYTLKVFNSDTDYLTATTTSDASPTTYNVEIKNLAQKHTLASASFADTTSAIGSGTITIDFGTYDAMKTTFTANPDKTSVNIAISPGVDNLTAIRDAINNSGAGVSASIIQDASGARLTISSSDTGADYALKITVDDDDLTDTNATGLSAFAYDPTTGVNSMSESIAAKDSLVNINGLDVTNSTNTLSDTITGMTLNLKKAELGKIITLTVDDNKDQLKANVNEFIKQYNQAIASINVLIGYNSETQQGGPLQGDIGLNTLKNKMKNMISDPIEISGNPFRILADIGIKTNQEGLLELDSTKFNSLLSSNYKEIGALFAKSATVTDGNIQISKLPNDIKAGTYGINLTDYTPGVSMAGTIGGFNATSADGLTLNGSDILTGLSMKVYAGTTGDRGSMTVYDGLAVQLNDLLDSYLSSDGILTQRTNSLNSQLKDLDSQNYSLNIREDSLTRRYTKQFTALDAMLSQMYSTMDFLSKQLDALPQISSGRK